MKNFMLSILCLSSVSIFAQQKQHQAFEALTKADMAALSNLLDENVELCFNENVNFLDKAAAIKEIKNFLSQNPAKNVSPMHNGISKNKGSQFYIGLLQSTNGKSFRVFLYTELIDNKAVIKEIRINKEEK